jgi:DNA-binding Lrp family transcriptional regulator
LHDSLAGHRHLALLEELERQGNVSQRFLAERLGIAASLVNRLIAELVARGYVEVVDPAVRPFAYRVSGPGREYQVELTDARFRSVVGTFREMQSRIRHRLGQIMDSGVKRVVFYGAGEVMEVTYPLAQSVGLEVVGLVDDDPERQGERKEDLVIRSPASLPELAADAVLITTFRHAATIQSKIGRSVQLLEL